MDLKKKIKLLAKNNAFRLAYLLAIKRLGKIVNNSSIKPQKKTGRKILFNLVYGMYGKIIFWECALAKSLQLRGHEVSALICGNALTMCTTEYTVNSAHNDKTCKLCVDFSHNFLDIVGIPYSTYYKYISKEEIQKIKDRVKKMSQEECKNLVYKDVYVGAFSNNSVLRYFMGLLNPDKNEYDRVLRSELINAIIATDIAEKIVKKEKPDVLVTRHLGYGSWGSFAEYCSNKGVEIRSPGEGYSRNKLRFDIFDIKDTNNAFDRYFKEVRENKFLNKEEEKDLKDFLEKRIAGTEGDTADYVYDQNQLKKEEFNFEKYDKTLALFPNVPWDSSLRFANVGFSGVYEWVKYTIEQFKSIPNYQLIVKIHPSELRVLKSKNNVLDYVNETFKSLPDNIKIIPPDTKISPYDLFKYLDAGIVYNGTIGLELVLNKISVIAAGRTHYGNKGFTNDASTKDEYKKLLFGKIPSIDEKTLNLAKVYAYFFFIKSFLPYDIIIANNRTLKYGWNINSLDDLSEGKNKYLDHICNYISHDIIYQDW